MSIDENSIIPKYYQLREDLLEYIRRNNFGPGSLLPSENELLQQYPVSRNTVRQAFTSLESDGLVYKVRGKGTFYKGNPESGKVKSHLIGVITPVTYESIYLDIFNGIENYAHKKKFQVVLSNSTANPHKERQVLEAMLKTGIEGLIIEPALSGRIKSKSYIYRKLMSIQIPVIVIDCWIKNLNRPSVTLNDVEYGYRAVQYLMSMKHRRIAYIYKKGVIAANQRLEGYRKALKEAGISEDPHLLAFFDEDEEQTGNKPSARLTHELMNLSDPPTAYFYFNDQYAVEGIHVLKEAGISIPEDASVIGIDDSYYANVAGMSLTTLAHPKEKMGLQAAEMLISEIENPGSIVPDCTMIEPKLIVRDTVARPKKR